MAVALSFVALGGPGMANAGPVSAIPPECSSMTFTKTIHVTASVAFVPDSGVLLVYGRQYLTNNITVPNATQVCLVGGTQNDVLITGRGADVIIGNGYGRIRDTFNAQGGSDTCYGAPGTLFTNCESQNPP